MTAELDPPDAVLPTLGVHRPRDLDREACLAHAARPPQGDQSMTLEQAAHVTHERLAADERRPRTRQHARRTSRPVQYRVLREDQRLQLAQSS